MTKTALPPAWEMALLSLREAKSRVPSRVSIHEVPAPREIAPYAVAVGAQTQVHAAAQSPAAGRLVVLFDPDEQPNWGGRFRVIGMLSTEAELEMGEDPLAGEVAWSWLRDSLDQREVEYQHLVGTATATINRAFSGSQLRESTSTLEIRASWTPQSPDLSAHLLAWLDTMLQATGLYPEDNVTQLRH